MGNSLIFSFKLKYEIWVILFCNFKKKVKKINIYRYWFDYLV